MSRWEEDFDNHGIHQTLKEVRECLDVEVEEPTSSLTLERRRLLKVLDMIDVAVAALDKETVPLPTLTAINSHLQNSGFLNNIQAYKNNPDVSYLTTANAEIDSQLPSIYQLSGFQKSQKAILLTKSVEESFDTLSKVIEAKSEEFSDKVDELAGELHITAGEQDILKSDIDSLASDHGEKLDEWRAEFRTSQQERSEDYSRAETARSTKYEEWLAPFQKNTEVKADLVIEDTSKVLTDFFQQFKGETDEMRTDARTRHTQILELHGLVAGDGVVAGYVNNAESEKKQADFWRWIAISFIVATAIWLGLSYSGEVSPDISAGNILARMARIVPLTAVFLYGAVYASKQSSFHRDSEKQTRWFALEVKAIDPFIASLDSEQQKQIKESLTERIFGQNRGTSVSTDTNNVDPNMLKIILDAMKDIAK